MVKNYDSVVSSFLKYTTCFKQTESTKTTKIKKQKYSFLLVVIAMFSFVFTMGQTTLIDPSGDGGFENGSTLAANGWTAVNATTDGWQVGNVPVAATGSKCGYVSANGGGTWTYSQISNVTHIYKDFTIPAGENKLTISFKWKAGGEGTTTSDWDNLKIFLASTSYVPTTSAVTGQTQLSGPGATSGMYKLNSASWNTETFSFAAVAGTTYRLIFSWKSDVSTIANPPAALDDISLISSLPGNFISVNTGNWGAASTWDANAVPSMIDNVTVTSGHTVTIDSNNQSASNLIINGTLGFGAIPTAFSVNGNLTVNTGGKFNVFNGTTGKTLTTLGNIINNGIIDVSVGTTTTGTLTLAGNNVQTVSGSGTFNTNVIRNLLFTNTSIATPNINWLVNNVKIGYNLNITGARINLGTNKLTFGNNAAAGTLTAPNGSGFLTGSKFSRWFTAATTGSAITAGVDPTVTTTKYPFIDANGLNRAMYISRTNTTDAVAGELAVTYNNASTVTSGLSIVDGAYTVTDRYDGNWVVSNEGTPIASSSYGIALIAQNAFFPLNGNSRIIGANAVIGGVHQNGTITPGAQRITVSQADLLSGPLYLGIASLDVPFVSVVNGNWNDASTWNKGVVPTCNDLVVIATGTNVTVNSIDNESKSITVSAGGTLTVSSGYLTVGCTFNNNVLTNNGTLTVTGGEIYINGNLMSNAGSTFNQSGGEILVDGNNGDLGNSVATGTPLVRLTASAPSNLNLTGGTIMIANPHAGASTSDYALSISQGGAANAASPNHTVQFGDGVSDTAGGHANGFYVYLFPGAFYYSLGNVTVDALPGTNRFVKTLSNIGILGNLTITTGEYQLASNHIIAGNVVNNGTLTATSLMALGTFVAPSNILPSTNAQSVSGSGVFRNLLVSPTAGLTNFQVSNTSATGVTLNVPLSVSGTFTMNNGIINTTDANLLTLGTATAAGTLAPITTADTYINGPFARTIGNSNTGYVLFPVGKAAYSPIELLPTTTALSVIKAQAFNSNTGTADASIMSLATNRRWETTTVSGDFTDVKVRLGDALLVNENIPVQAPTATGVYSSVFGSVAPFVAGAPNTIEATNAIAKANFTGFISFAKANACSGTPTPGNSIVSESVICFGESVTLSLQNVTAGSGVTYQWKTSLDGVIYTVVAGATSSTYTFTPAQAAYYLCDVTCASGAVTGTSTAVLVDFSNKVIASVDVTRCGTGTVTLNATPSAGATISWYATATGGAKLATGNSFTTPSIVTTTTYYAGAAAASNGNATLGAGASTSTSFDGVFYHLYGGLQTQYLVRASELTAMGLSAGNINSIAINMASASTQAYAGFALSIANTTNTTMTNLVSTGFTSVFTSSSYTPTVGINTFTFGSPYVWDGVSNIVIKFCWSNNNGGGTSSFAKVDNPGFQSTAFYRSDTESSSVVCGATSSSGTSSLRPQFIFNGQVACNSPRVAVVATVTAPPAITISASSSEICSGDSTAPITITSGAADYDSFVWSPATGVSGDAVTGFVFNPATTTTFTLTASQSTGALCSTVVTHIVNVNLLPTAMTISPATPEVCVNGIQALTVTGGTIGFVGKIGAGIATNTLSTPYKALWGSSKSQALYTPAELTALGMTAGQKISSIGYVALSGTPNVLNGFTISAGFVSNTTLGTAFISGATNLVLAPSAYTAPTGVGNLDYILSTPLVWDGVSSLLVETCFNNNNSGTSSTNTISVQSTIVASGLNLYLSKDNTADTCTSTLVPSATTTRPNLRISTLESTNITWSPVANLYTDAAATIAYTGANATTVYVKSATAGSQAYTATTTVPLTGCARSATVNVGINSLPVSTVTLSGNTLTTAEAGATYQWVLCDGSFTPIAGATNQSYVATAIGNYAVIVTKNGCSVTSDCFNVTTLSNNSFDLTKLSYYPNPVIDKFTVTYAGTISSIQVYDISGRLVKNINANANEVTVDMSDMAASVYIVKVAADNTSGEFKVIKK